MALLSQSRGVFTPALLAVMALVAGCAKEEAKWCPYGEGIYCPAGSSCAARQALCIWDACGNGHVDGIEACDDGNKIDGDGCSAICDSTEICGNGVPDDAVDEACDDGNTVSGDGCSADCRSIEACGSGDIDPGEDCDGGPGASNNEAQETPVCTPSCRWSICGDGYRNESANEACDGGDPEAPGRRETADCNSDCTRNECGDGKKNMAAQEECDDGDRNGDAANCLRDCSLNVCGDGYKHASREECDLGVDNSTTGACVPGCRLARCGDGYIQDGVEACDSGPDSNTGNHACPYGQASCQVCNWCQWAPGRVAGFCGDGTRQEGYEVCDHGANNGNTVCPYSATGGTCEICNATCTALVPATGPYCGDGQRTSGEVCDDGARNGTTYCPQGASCERICRAGCQSYLTAVEYCGDGARQEAYELCDQGRDRNGTTVCPYSAGGSCEICNATCSALVPATGPRCGDGTRQMPDEACDNGDRNGATYCPEGTSCRICSSDCKVESAGGRCGDGTRQEPNEACDHGGNNGSTVCQYSATGTCEICNATCTELVAASGPYCGDGTRQMPQEACDDGAINGSRYCRGGAKCDGICRTGCQSIEYDVGWCGDSDRDRPQEDCDNEASFQCGTCGRAGEDNACKDAPFAKAYGRITVLSTELEGVAIWLADSASNWQNISFVRGTPSGAQVDVTGRTPAQVAEALASAIRTHSLLAMDATFEGNVVTVTNEQDGVAGNQRIGLAPGDSTDKLSVEGMSHGVGCGARAWCVRNEDCLSRSCSGFRCN